MDKRSSDNKTAYQILKIEGCPFRLPSADSMQELILAYKVTEDIIIKWYEENKKNIRDNELQRPCQFCDSLDGGQYGTCPDCDRAELN